MKPVLNIVSDREYSLTGVDPSLNGHAHSRLEPQPRLQTVATTSTAPATPAPSTTRKVMFAGFDWGTNKCCIKAAHEGAEEIGYSCLIPTVVGYAKEGIVEGLLPEDATVLFGDEALKHRLHLNLVAPMVDGVVKDAASARELMKHLRSRMAVAEGTEIRAVIGVPANADNSARESIRQCVASQFDRVLLVPEPFLAALGFRDDSRRDDPSYRDPVRNSLFIDIGAGTTDLCLVQGFYPTAEDQISFAFAGDKVDAMFYDGLRKVYPDCDLSRVRVREIKEQHSFVGVPAAPAVTTVMVAGKPRKIDVTEPLGAACTELLRQSLEAARELIARASSDSVGELLGNIIITGGGSRIRGIDAELKRLLMAEGYENVEVHLAGERYQEFVALGALKAARQAREKQWQQIIK